MIGVSWYLQPTAAGTLQEVTDAGNETTNSILVNRSGANGSVIANDAVRVFKAANVPGIELDGSGADAQIIINTGDGSTKTRLQTNAAGNRLVKFPDAAGVVALTSNINLQNVMDTGNTGSGSLQVNSNVTARLLLSQNGDGPGTYGYIDYFNTANRVRLQPNLLSTNRVINIPDANGTLLSGTKGQATLVAGTVNITDANTQVGSVVSVTLVTIGGSTIGATYLVNVTANVGFTITSYTVSGAVQTLDTSIVRYAIMY